MDRDLGQGVATDLLATFLAIQAIIAVLWAMACFIGMGAGPVGALPLLFFLPMIGVMITVIIRRLHDRDKSAWWLIPFCLMPYLCECGGATVMGLRGSTPLIILVAGAVTLAGFGLGLWGTVEIWFVPGTRGDNRFGPDPLGRAARV